MIINTPYYYSRLISAQDVIDLGGKVVTSIDATAISDFRIILNGDELLSERAIDGGKAAFTGTLKASDVIEFIKVLDPLNLSSVSTTTDADSNRLYHNFAIIRNVYQELKHAIEEANLLEKKFIFDPFFEQRISDFIGSGRVFGSLIESFAYFDRRENYLSLPLLVSLMLTDRAMQDGRIGSLEGNLNPNSISYIGMNLSEFTNPNSPLFGKNRISSYAPGIAPFFFGSTIAFLDKVLFFCLEGGARGTVHFGNKIHFVSGGADASAKVYPNVYKNYFHFSGETNEITVYSDTSPLKLLASDSFFEKKACPMNLTINDNEASAKLLSNGEVDITPKEAITPTELTPYTIKYEYEPKKFRVLSKASITEAGTASQVDADRRVVFPVGEGFKQLEIDIGGTVTSAREKMYWLWDMYLKGLPLTQSSVFTMLSAVSGDSKGRYFAYLKERGTKNGHWSGTIEWYEEGTLRNTQMDINLSTGAITFVGTTLANPVAFFRDEDFFTCKGVANPYLRATSRLERVEFWKNYSNADMTSKFGITPTSDLKIVFLSGFKLKTEGDYCFHLDIAGEGRAFDRVNFERKDLFEGRDSGAFSARFAKADIASGAVTSRETYSSLRNKAFVSQIEISPTRIEITTGKIRAARKLELRLGGNSVFARYDLDSFHQSGTNLTINKGIALPTDDTFELKAKLEFSSDN